MKKLCVASVYGPTPDNPLWIHLQRTFLQRCTDGDYEHIVYLDKVEDAGVFAGCTIIGQNTDLGCHHARGLNLCVDYFLANPAESYLILDSDCFPVQKKWNLKLEGILRKTSRHFAAIMRTEIGEVYPHPSGMLILGEHLTKEAFNFNKGSSRFRNLISGVTEGDVGGKVVTNVNNKKIWMPLLRTNKYNPHHIAAGIYGNIFYHHGAGTQKTFRRARRYWEIFAGKEHKDQLTVLKNNLIRRPHKFINALRGIKEL